MGLLIVGLVLFLGVHSVRLIAPQWRERRRAQFGPQGWRALYSVVSLAGFVLLIWGFSRARLDPTVLYVPPLWLRHANALFTLLALILFAAAYVPRNHLKAWLGHPMLAGVKLWAGGHLLATGMLHDVVLFGAFLLWAVVDFAGCRRRDRAAGTVYPAGTLGGDVIAAVVGAALWALIAFWAHQQVIGVNPLG